MARTHKFKLAIVVLIIVSSTAVFLVSRPSQITFSYAKDECASKIIFLPTLKSSDNSDFFIYTDEDISIFGKKVMSKKLCIHPKNEPQQGQSFARLSPFGLKIFGEKVTIKVPEAPIVLLDKVSSPLPTQEPALIPLSSEDNTFSYALHVEEKDASCESKKDGVLCDVPALGLTQGREYTFEIKKSFKDDPAQAVETKTVKTLSATKITKSSVKEAEVVYKKIKEITFTTDKPLLEADVKVYVASGDAKTEVKTTSQVQNNTIKVLLAEDLEREKTFEVVVDSVKAEDGSSLSSPYKIRFDTSGGPQVTGVNISSYGVSPQSTIIVTFDQALSADQDIASIASIKGIPATISSSANTVRYSLGSADLCSGFSLSINGKVSSEYAVERDVSWSYSSRLRCHSVSTIGYSVNGRSILAYSFGSGEPMLFIGAMHGDERSGGFLMDQFIDDLEANYGSIPKGRRVVIIPRVNPDAFSSVSRRNANNVDLNRNFPTNDWKSDVTMPGGQLIEGGGGSEPLSEPESKAIANYTLSLRPKLVLTYHAVANNVIANESGISWDAAAKYAQLSGYAHVPKSATGEVFEYDTNGAYEDWLYEKQGIAALLIEMSSMSYSQFERNKPAMWAMLSL